MIPDGHETPHGAASTDRRDRCEACDSPGGTDVLFEIPVPTEVLESLGLPMAPLHPIRLLCVACAEKGLQGRKLDLLDLVNLAPIAVKQNIHAHLIQVFEI